MLHRARAGLHVLIAAAVIAAPMLAPEHVHEANAHHHDAVVHRHVAAHDHDAASVAGDDGGVVWLSSPGTLAAGAHVGTPSAAVSSFWLHAPTLRSRLPHQYTPEVSHGPPRALLPSRAPPAPL